MRPAGPSASAAPAAPRVMLGERSGWVAAPPPQRRPPSGPRGARGPQPSRIELAAPERAARFQPARARQQVEAVLPGGAVERRRDALGLPRQPRRGVAQSAVTPIDGGIAQTWSPVRLACSRAIK